MDEIRIFFMDSVHYGHDLKGLGEGIADGIKLSKQPTGIGLMLVWCLVTLRVFLEGIHQYHSNFYPRSADICLLQAGKLLKTLDSVSIVGVPKH